MSGAREQLEEAIAVCRDVDAYFSAHPSENAEDLEMAEKAEVVIRNLEPLLGRIFLKTKSAQMTTYPCQQNAQRIAELLAEVKGGSKPLAEVRGELTEEFETLDRNAEIVKSAAASRDTIIT